MKHIGQTLKDFIESRRLVKKDIAAQANISPTYLSEIFQKESIDAAILERICHAINLNPASFFDVPLTPGTISDISASTVIGSATVTIGETQALRELIAEKERTIQILLRSKATSSTNSEENLNNATS